VGEPDPAAGAPQDARRLGPPQAGRCPIPSRRRRNHSYGERPNVASALTA
jgi:hypothetical protein